MKTKSKSEKPEAKVATKVFIQDYKGSETFSIHDLKKVKDNGGEPGKDSFIIGFGIRKAKALIEHLGALKKYVEDNEA